MDREIEQICRTEGEPRLEFRYASHGAIEWRELGLSDETTIWRTLTRSEMIHYLNYGGIVGFWLNGLVEGGLIQIRQQPRYRVAFPIVARKNEWARIDPMDFGPTDSCDAGQVGWSHSDARS